jgi:hypothetical protein
MFTNRKVTNQRCYITNCFLLLFFFSNIDYENDTFITQFSEENGESKFTSEENLLYTIRDQSAIFREYIMYCSLKNQALSSLIV